MKNGELLKMADTQFDLFVTTDQNLRHQQNFSEFHLAILVLPFANWPKLQQHLTTIVSTANKMKPTDYVELKFT